MAGTEQTTQDSGRLERELVATRQHLRSLIDEYEAAQEAMKATNEEILWSAEKLRSTNKNLQYSNDELATLNDEMKDRNSDLRVLTDDLNNLLLGVDIAVLVLDCDLRIRRFTPVAGTLLHLIAADVGRPFSDIASVLDVGDWKELLRDVMVNGRIVEREVPDRNGHRYSLRVRPYKTNDNRIEGVLIVMLDIDSAYRARDEAQKSGDYARAIVETIREALVVVDAEGCILSVNYRFCELFRVASDEMTGKPVLGRDPGQFDDPKLRDVLTDIFARGGEIQYFEIAEDFPRVGPKSLRLGAGRIGGSTNVLIAIEDETVQKRTRELEKSESTIRALLDSCAQSVLTVSAAGEIVTSNAHTETMFGYPLEELAGRPADMLITSSATGMWDKKERALGGLALSVEGHRNNGTVFPAEMSLSTVQTPSGRLTVAFVSDISVRAQLEKSTRMHAAQVQALAARLLTAQEEERRRVSRELHDQICQQLAALAIDISAFAAAPSPPPADRERRLKELQKRVVQASEATRHIAYQLHPSVLDDLGLVASLRALCKQFSDRQGIEIRFQSGVLPSDVPREVGSCVYRVAQESLQNIARHSGAKKAAVRLGMKKRNLVLSILDDGTGFDPDTARGQGGLGLVGMEERARLVKGALSVLARTGEGTKITLSVPLRVARGNRS